MGFNSGVLPGASVYSRSRVVMPGMTIGLVSKVPIQSMFCSGEPMSQESKPSGVGSVAWLALRTGKRIRYGSATIVVRRHKLFGNVATGRAEDLLILKWIAILLHRLPATDPLGPATRSFGPLIPRQSGEIRVLGWMNGVQFVCFDFREAVGHAALAGVFGIMPWPVTPLRSRLRPS